MLRQKSVSSTKSVKVQLKKQHVVIRNTPRLPYAIGLITAYLQTQHMLENVENVPKVKENKKDVQIFDTTNEQNANLAIAFQKMLVEAIRVPERTMSMRSFRKGHAIEALLNMLKQQPMATDTAIKKMLTTDKNWDSDACMLYINAATNEQQYARERIQAKAHRRQGFAPENEMLFLADLKELGWQPINMRGTLEISQMTKHPQYNDGGRYTRLYIQRQYESAKFKQFLRVRIDDLPNEKCNQYKRAVVSGWKIWHWHKIQTRQFPISSPINNYDARIKTLGRLLERKNMDKQRAANQFAEQLQDPQYTKERVYELMQ